MGPLSFTPAARTAPIRRRGRGSISAARAGVAVHLGGPRDRVQEIAGIHVDAFPKPYDVTLMPQGMVGRTPALWIGATLGLAVRP